MPDRTTMTLEVPGAILAYDVRPNNSTTEPPLLLIGSPMGASGSATARRLLPRPHGRHVRPARR